MQWCRFRSIFPLPQQSTQRHRPIIVLLIALVVALPNDCQAASKFESLPDWWQAQEATAGVNLSVQEISREISDPAFEGRQSVAIRLVTSGFPKDKSYELWRHWLDGLTSRIADLRVSDGGKWSFGYSAARNLSEPIFCVRWK